MNFINNSVVLRARNSELFILPQHVAELQKMLEPKKFSSYFMQEALCNRTARKLFEAWLRKDTSVWQRLFKLIHENKAEEEATIEEPVTSKQAKPKPAKKEATKKASDDKEKAKSPAKPKPAKIAEEKSKEEGATVKKAAKKTKAKATTKKAVEKTSSTVKKVSKKTTTKKST